jgi:predicted TPR repeat methyltransferase
MTMPDLIESAFALHAAGALADAEIAYKRILAANPQHTEAQHYLGVLLHQRGETPAGLSLVLQALEADSGSASRYNDLGNILVQAGDFANAATAFDCSIKLNGNDANAWNNLGSVLHRQGDVVGAESAYKEALRCDTDFASALTNLASLLGEIGREEEASLYWCQAYVLPPLTDKPPKMLGVAYYRLGRVADAAACYGEWLRSEPDNAYARHHLAACTGLDIPLRASDGFLTTAFDDMAEGFDERLVGKLTYRGPEIIAGLLEGRVAANGMLDVLDGGCGTGLCAPVLIPYARHLTGVDISPKMLAKARASNLYGALVEAELTAYLRDRENAFDLIGMADTLIYFGELAPLFAAVERALRPGGVFALTIELAPETANDQVDFRLGVSGRYAHSRRYLTQELSAAGFELLHSDDVALRTEFCQPTPGVGVLARALPR